MAALPHAAAEDGLPLSCYVPEFGAFGSRAGAGGNYFSAVGNAAEAIVATLPNVSLYVPQLALAAGHPERTQVE